MFSLSLVLALIVVLTACGAEATPVPPVVSEPATDAPAEPAADAPVEAEKVSLFGEFETVDTDDNTINESIFTDHKLTMVNIWATWCPPCLEELPDLGEINTEYAEKDFQIIGVVMDAVDFTDENLPVSEEIITLTNEIADKTDANYTHIIPNKDLVNNRLNEIISIPTSFFVDSEGNIVEVAGEDRVVGKGSKEQWVELIDSVLISVDEVIATTVLDIVPSFNPG